MMHLYHFEIEFRAENLDGLAREPKESVNSNAEIRSKHDRDLPRGICNSLPTLAVLASGSDDQNFARLCANLCQRGGRIGLRKVNDGLAVGKRRLQIVAEVNLRRYLKLEDRRRRMRRPFDPCDLAHR